MSCDPYTPAVYVPCTSCPVPGDVQDTPKGSVTEQLQKVLDSNAEVLRCLTSLCSGDRASEDLTVAAPAASTYGLSNIDSTDNAVDATLADGDFIGQEKNFIMTEASNSSTVTVANHETSVPEVFTFDALDEYLLLKWTGTVWITTSATATAV